MSSILSLIGRKEALFTSDINNHESMIGEMVSSSRFLVLGGAGSIGQAVVREIFKRNPQKLDVVDLSENNLAELIRDLRSSLGYIDGELRTFCLDIGSVEFDAFIQSDGAYDYVLNLAALKHVRSEKDPFTLMRLIDVNIFDTDKSIEQSIELGASKYFCVSTDKAANPANMMGASKRIMEMFLSRRSQEMSISTARFANVAYSDGSLLHSFNQRLLKNQPIVAPIDVRRFFVTAQESGELCLMSCLFGENRDIFFPKLDEALHQSSFSDIALKFLEQHGFEAHLCETEDEARALSSSLPSEGKWPCLFTRSDTTGEKEYEEFYTSEESPDLERYDAIGIITLEPTCDEDMLRYFEKEIAGMRERGKWQREEIVELFHQMIPDFRHLETGKFLDGKM